MFHEERGLLLQSLQYALAKHPNRTPGQAAYRWSVFIAVCFHSREMEELLGILPHVLLLRVRGAISIKDQI